MAAKKTANDLLADEIKDLYSAERQLTKAIPKMAKGSNDPALQDALKSHLEETKNQVARLEQISEILGIKPTGKKCVGMEGVIGEGAEVLEEDGDATVLDCAIVGAGRRVEHYEMAGYMTAIGLAQRVGQKDVVRLLKESLAEEEKADATLQKLGASLLEAAPTA